MKYTLVNVPKFNESRYCPRCLLNNVMLPRRQFIWIMWYECQYCHGIFSSQFLDACIAGICSFVKPRKTKHTPRTKIHGRGWIIE